LAEFNQGKEKGTMANPGFTKTFTAVGAIAAYTLVKPSGVNDGEAAPAAAATDAVFGISQNVDVADGQQVDVVLDDSANLLLGGTVAAFDPITSDANAKGVKAAPAAGVNNRIVGYALTSGVAGDIIPVLIKQGYVQG
jgi:hypothetical protein